MKVDQRYEEALAELNASLEAVDEALRRVNLLRGFRMGAVDNARLAASEYLRRAYDAVATAVEHVTEDYDSDPRVKQG